MVEFVGQQPVATTVPQQGTASIDAPGGDVARRAGSHPILQWLVNPWVDKALAIVAVLPFVYPIAIHFRQHFKFGEIVYLAQVLLLIGTMIFRRAPVRITTNKYYWVVSFVASYWGLFILSVEQPGRSLVGSRVLLPIYALGVFMDVWGRLSLGRNIGMLPAQRQIVYGGAYRWVRHPIYTSVFLLSVAGTLASFSLPNFLLYALGIVWFVERTLTEEEFLRSDPKYAAYMQRVRWRWLTGLI
ncbi:MAG TPA: methyltransferase [Verrucomicrobiae bacterium]|jgi:protein-S-isoprenylcysteine O-methyltransferase Ste14|nr:methyltransferase [Verrucomicrobiae bacterium]